MQRHGLCVEREQLKSEYRFAALTYTRLYMQVGSTKGGERFTNMVEKADQAKHAYHIAKWILKNHRTEHGC
jgi:hypothetical protein